jgi:hypothetical protein
MNMVYDIVIFLGFLLLGGGILPILIIGETGSIVFKVGFGIILGCINVACTIIFNSHVSGVFLRNLFNKPLKYYGYELCKYVIIMVCHTLGWVSRYVIYHEMFRYWIFLNFMVGLLIVVVLCLVSFAIHYVYYALTGKKLITLRESDSGSDFDEIP